MDNDKLEVIWTYTYQIFDLIHPEMVLWSNLICDLFAFAPVEISNRSGISTTISCGTRKVKISYCGDLTKIYGETWTLQATSKEDADYILKNFMRNLVPPVHSIIDPKSG